MSTLYLIRHGQASFGQANYDRLSELGERQASLLGEYWARWGVTLDAAYIGALERQRKSATLAGEAFAAAGKPFPKLTIIEEWNEYGMQAMLSGGVPRAIAQNPEVARIIRELAPDGKLDFVKNQRSLAVLLGKTLDLWVEGKLTVPGLESWSEFVARVGRGLDRVMAEQGAGKTVAVFTSGGPISAVLQRALAVPDLLAMRAGWIINNASISEFRYSQGRLSLVSFNATPHLAEPALISVR